MIIYKSGLLTLDYDPGYDILYINWPDVQEYLIPELRQSLSIVVDHVRSYDIKNLMVDTTKSTLEISADEYKEVLKEFGRNLTSTRLQKLARVLTLNETRETKIEEAKNEIHFAIALRTFSNKEEALHWLKGPTASSN
ncbi:hypothetical protein [Rufibacter psychrotolerans]|uniref:hypothetical protein n=1 Tax=Rufibacter psychrotolerans TaxID=2812556 RepID=UPI001967ECAC|nr:hypothetical protein [Rufibacter sp. SYSU D00308]